MPEWFMYEARLQRVVERLQAEGLDALLVCYSAKAERLPNVFYLSGFTGSTAMLLIGREHRWFLTDFRYHEQMAQEVREAWELVDSTGKKLVEEILPVLAEAAALKRVGFASEHVSHAMHSRLADADGIEFVATEGWIEDLRLVKDEQEIESLRSAVRLGERIMTEVWGVIAPGVTEADLAAEIHYRALKHGATSCSFAPIVASGENASKPHAGFTTQKLTPGAPLTIDMGVVLAGYCSDMTRTVFYRDCPAEWRQIYETVRSAKDLGFAEVRPGVTGKAVDAAAREHVYRAGFEGRFEHGFGHGVGIEVHEAPALARTADAELRSGMVVTNEPGIYLPGRGGVRIEDMVVVSEDGAENLNELDTELRVVG
jgi:Xaa-Pro aminopeptidase